MLTIRRAKPEDCPGIARLHTSAVRAISTDLYTPEEIAAWAIPRTLEDYQQSIRGKEFYAAVEGDLIVGFGVLNQESRVIEAVYVGPDGTGRGVGQLVLRTLEEWARDLGLGVLSLYAWLNAVRFYERAGYEAQQMSEYRLASGVEIPCIPMINLQATSNGPVASDTLVLGFSGNLQVSRVLPQKSDRQLRKTTARRSSPGRQGSARSLLQLSGTA